MKKAVFFSFLIHALIFFLAVYFLPEPVKQNVYRVLTVSIRPEAVPEMVLEEVVQETGALPDVGPQTVPKKKELLETEQKRLWTRLSLSSGNLLQMRAFRRNIYLTA